MNISTLLKTIVNAFVLISICACTPEQECVEIDVEIVVTDTRAGRNEGSARVQANFGGTYNYEWDTGLTLSRIDGLKEGEYCVTVTAAITPECETVLCGEVKLNDPIGNQSVDDGMTKILFIGNSHTYYHDLPETVGTILNKSNLPKPIILKNSTRGGWRFQNHAEDIETTATIRSSNWDYVVLQENAGVASISQEEAETLMYPFAETLHDQIIDNNPETQVILYMTHAYEEGLDNCATDPNNCTYEMTQNEIRRNYLYLSELIDSKVAPAGIMWKMILAKELGIDLFDTDKIHPSPEGSQVSAAVVATTISRELLEANYLDRRIFSLAESETIIRIINN